MPVSKKKKVKSWYYVVIKECVEYIAVYRVKEAFAWAHSFVIHVLLHFLEFILTQILINVALMRVFYEVEIKSSQLSSLLVLYSWLMVAGREI